MHFLADENFRLDVIKFLRSEGHNVEILTPRSSDELVAAVAKKEKRILLTNDTDFSITLKFPPLEYSGILIFRIHPPSFQKFKAALNNFFILRTPREIRGKTFLIEEESFFELE